MKPTVAAIAAGRVCTAPGFPETGLRDSRPHGVSLLRLIVAALVLSRGHVPDRPQEALPLVPGYAALLRIESTHKP
jgi:hypothetical protein